MSGWLRSARVRTLLCASVNLVGYMLICASVLTDPQRACKLVDLLIGQLPHRLDTPARIGDDPAITISIIPSILPIARGRPLSES